MSSYVFGGDLNKTIEGPFAVVGGKLYRGNPEDSIKVVGSKVYFNGVLQEKAYLSEEPSLHVYDIPVSQELTQFEIKGGGEFIEVQVVAGNEFGLRLRSVVPMEDNVGFENENVLYFIPADNNKCKLVVTVPDSLKMLTLNRINSLDIDDVSLPSLALSVDCEEYTCPVTITNAKLCELNTCTENGKILLDSLECRDDLTIEKNNDPIHVSNSKFHASVYIVNRHDDVRFKNFLVEGSIVEIQTSTGDVIMDEGVISGSVLIETVSGKITVSDYVGKGDLRITSGPGVVNVYGYKSRKKLFVTSEAGDIKLSVLSGLYVNASSSSGDIHIDQNGPIVDSINLKSKYGTITGTVWVKEVHVTGKDVVKRVDPPN